MVFESYSSIGFGIVVVGAGPHIAFSTAQLNLERLLIVYDRFRIVFHPQPGTLISEGLFVLFFTCMFIYF